MWLVPCALSLMKLKLVHFSLCEHNASSARCNLISAKAIRGDRSYMEDAYYISKDGNFIGLYDGHGGKDISDFMRFHFYDLFQDRVEYCALRAVKDVKTIAVECFLKAFEKANAAVKQVSAWRDQGSTAVVVWLQGGYICTANLGDSRAVLCRNKKAMELSVDHKPNSVLEKQRIEELGGTVKWYGYVDLHGKPIMDSGCYRVNGNLAVSRSIGDFDEKPFISGVPDVMIQPRQPGKDEFIILASDGLWDVFTSSEAVDFVNEMLIHGVGAWPARSSASTQRSHTEWTQKYGNDRSLLQAMTVDRKQRMASYLVEEALLRGSSDNITAVVVWMDSNTEIL